MQKTLAKMYLIYRPYAGSYGADLIVSPIKRANNSVLPIWDLCS
jgi:hypothetical protein